MTHEDVLLIRPLGLNLRDNESMTHPSHSEILVLGGGCFWCTEAVYVQVKGVVLLEIFFVIHDPTTLNRQGNDRGTQYRSGVYVTSPAQAEVAKALIAEIEAENVFDTAVVTEVVPLQNYSAAEEYHQDFFERNPTQGYCLAVAAPKVWKFKKTFSDWVKPK